MQSFDSRIDDPPQDIGRYVEDVLPLVCLPHDVMRAFSNRGFKYEGWTPPTWRRQVRGGKSGHMLVVATHNSYVLEYWPTGPSRFDYTLERVRKTGNIRAILRETDRMIAAFEPEGWEKL